MEAYQICLIVWAAVFVITLVAELITDELVSVWFCIGSLFALVVAAIFQKYYWISIIVFIVISSVSLTVFLVFFRKLVFKPAPKTNAQELIGQKFKVCQATDEATNHAQVKIRDIVYSASSDTKLSVGDEVIIDKIEGNHLLVTKAKEESNNE